MLLDWPTCLWLVGVMSIQVAVGVAACWYVKDRYNIKEGIFLVLFSDALKLVVFGSVGIVSFVTVTIFQVYENEQHPMVKFLGQV